MPPAVSIGALAVLHVPAVEVSVEPVGAVSLVSVSVDAVFVEEPSEEPAVDAGFVAVAVAVVSVDAVPIVDVVSVEAPPEELVVSIDAAAKVSVDAVSVETLSAVVVLGSLVPDVVGVASVVLTSVDVEVVPVPPLGSLAVVVAPESVALPAVEEVVSVAVASTVAVAAEARERVACDANPLAGRASPVTAWVAGLEPGAVPRAAGATEAGDTDGAADDVAVDGEDVDGEDAGGAPAPADAAAGDAAAEGAAGGAAAAVGITPIVSVMTGAFAKGSTGFFAVFADVVAAVAICVCLSETTGTRRRTLLRAPPAEPALAGLVFAGFGSGGRGTSRWSFGTRNNGKPADGTDNAGRGAGPPLRCEDCRSARAIGPTYQRTTSTMPSEAHQ